MSVFFNSEGHIGLERKVTKLEAMLKMLQEDLKKVGNLAAFKGFYAHIYMYSQYNATCDQVVVV